MKSILKENFCSIQPPLFDTFSPFSQICVFILCIFEWKSMKMRIFLHNWFYPILALESWKRLFIRMPIDRFDWYCTMAHCSYLNIYISRKIRLCGVDLEGQFHTTLLANDIIFLIWNLRSIILIFLLFFAGVVKSTVFCTLLMLFPKGWIIGVTFLRQIAIQVFQLFGIAKTV